MGKNKQLKICYISTTSFTDVDVNFFRIIEGHYDLNYHVLIPAKRSNYTLTEIVNLSKSSRTNFIPLCLSHRIRNPFIICEYIRLFREIHKIKPDIIIINNDDLFFNICCQFIKANNVIISMHDVVNHNGLENVNWIKKKVFAFAKQLLLRKFNNFLTYSKNQQEILCKLKPNAKVYMIHMPLKDFGNVPKSLNQEKMSFLFFGNIHPYKGLTRLLVAINKLAKTSSNFEFIIAGRCDDWDKTYAKLINSNVVKLHIRHIENYEIASLFSKVHFLVLPYLNSTQSGVIQIAYNYNVPVIASNLSSFTEFIKDGVSGFLFDTQNDEDLLRILDKCIGLSNEEYVNIQISLKEYIKDNYSQKSILDSFSKMIFDISI